MKLQDLFEAGPLIDNIKGLGAVGASSNIDYLGFRVLVKPSVFLKLAAPHPNPRSDYIEQHIAAGEPIGAPFLSVFIPQEWISDESRYDQVIEGDLTTPAQIVGHEGRHRMTAILRHYGDEPVETHLLFSGLRRRHLTDNMIERLNESIISQTRKLVKGPWFIVYNSTNINESTSINKTTREDLESVAEWLGTTTDQLRITLIQEPIEKFSKQIKELYDSYDEFPEDAKRTQRILRLLKQGGNLLPVYVEQNDPTLFVMEGRHRMVAFWLAGLNTIPVAYVSKSVSENFADGKGPGRPGDSRRHGIPKGATLAQLDRIGKGKGRKAQLARWQANMRRGRRRATNEAIAPHGSPENEFELMKSGAKPAALVGYNTFHSLYKTTADQRRWPYIQIEIPKINYNSFVVGQPGEELRVKRIAMLVKDMNANSALGMKPGKEYHIEMGRLLGYSDQDIRDFLKRVQLAEGKSNPDAALTVFDIDETLFHTKAKVLVIKNNKVVKELSNREFNTYSLEPNESFDFRQFRDAKFFNDTSVPIEKMWQKAKSTLDTVGRRPGSKVIIVTARSDFDDRETFLDTFRKHGLDIDKIHVHRAGNLGLPSGEAKKQIIAQYLATGEFNMVRLFDDADTNLKSFLSLKNDFPDIKFTAFKVMQDGSVSEYQA